MDLSELARMLGVEQKQASRMAQRGEIPCMKVAGQLRFNRAEITGWLQQRMQSLNKDHLVKMDVGIGSHRQINPEDLIISDLLRTVAIDTSLPARTKNSVIKELVLLAQRTELVYDSESLLEALYQREELCSTAIDGGFAFPHPRRPLPYAVAEPILVVARTGQGIGFGAPDGRLTDLFIMTCSQDDRHHLHILARLCHMLHEDAFVQNLREAASAGEVVELMQKRETVVMSNMV